MSGGDVDLQAIPHDGSHLTPDQARTIDAYLIEALDALNLGNWRVYVGKDLPPEHAVLSIFPTDGRRIAILNVTADWWTSRTSDEKRVDITHECLHLAHHDTDEHVRRRADAGDGLDPHPKVRKGNRDGHQARIVLPRHQERHLQQCWQEHQQYPGRRAEVGRPRQAQRQGRGRRSAP